MQEITADQIPNYVLDLFNEINHYHSLLPEYFRKDLTVYMYHLSNQIINFEDIESPDHEFNQLKLNFSTVKKTIYN